MTPTFWQKFLHAIPLVGVLPSASFDEEIKEEIDQARSAQLAGKVVHLLTIRNEHLSIAGTRDLFTSALLTGLLALDWIKKPDVRTAFICASVYFFFSSNQKDDLIHQNRQAIPKIKEGRFSCLP